MSYWHNTIVSKNQISAENTDEQIKGATCAQLKNALSQHGPYTDGKKASLVKQAMVIRDCLLAAKQEEEKIAEEKHAQQLANELNDATTNEKRQALYDLAEKREMQARETYDEFLTEMRKCDNIAYWVKWDQAKAMEAEAYWVEIQKLRNFMLDQMNVPTLTFDEIIEHIRDMRDIMLDELLRCDPTNMGMVGLGAPSLAEFAAKQKFTKLLTAIIRALEKDCDASYIRHIYGY
jgi:hypothetical protein